MGRATLISNGRLSYQGLHGMVAVRDSEIESVARAGHGGVGFGTILRSEVLFKAVLALAFNLRLVIHLRWETGVHDAGYCHL